MNIAHFLHNLPARDWNDMIEADPWVFQKRDDEEISISVKIDESFGNGIYIKDSNGNDIDGFTIVGKSKEDVKTIYDALKSDVESIEEAYSAEDLAD